MLSSAVRCTTTWRMRLAVLDCAHFHPGLAQIVYSSACVGSTSYFVVYAEVASEAENRQGAGIREGADQRYFTVLVALLTEVRRKRCIPAVGSLGLHSLSQHMYQ